MFLRLPDQLTTALHTDLTVPFHVTIWVLMVPSNPFVVPTAVQQSRADIQLVTSKPTDEPCFGQQAKRVLAAQLFDPLSLDGFQGFAQLPSRKINDRPEIICTMQAALPGTNLLLHLAADSSMALSPGSVGMSQPQYMLEPVCSPLAQKLLDSAMSRPCLANHQAAFAIAIMTHSRH